MITIDGNLVLSNSSVFDVELGGTAQGTEYDFVHVLSNATLGGTLSISFVNGFQTNVSSSDVFTNLTGELSLSGIFANIVSGQRLSTADGFGSFLVTYDGGQNLILSNFLLIPEPSPLMLAAVLGAILWKRGWRRKAQG
jgi:hypothetical protein